MIYIHIPFCRSFCTYCDFYSEAVPKCVGKEVVANQNTLFERFEKSLLTEISLRANEISGDVNTLYFGGGTPSVLPLSFYEHIFDTLRLVRGANSFDEFTVEVNPEDIVEKGEVYVCGLKELGVNRISMGIQSFDDSILRWMNRRHDSQTAIKAYSILEASGIENISIDLIFGLPMLTDKLWGNTIDSALSISKSGRKPSHISAYQLSVEPGSALAAMMRGGKFQEADDDTCRRQYEMLCSRLAAAGYHHYEISNFALPGMEAIHNSAYWRHVSYTGFGPGAHSFIRKNNELNPVRKWNLQDLNAYIDVYSKGNANYPSVCNAIVDSEILTEEQFFIEEIMLLMRTDKGVQKNVLKAHSDNHKVEAMLKSGSLVETLDGNIRIPENHFFVSDNILTEII